FLFCRAGFDAMIEFADMNGTVYRFFDCEVRVDSREVCVRGEMRTLGPRPFDLLVYLLQHCGRPVSKEEFLDKVWRCEVVSGRSIARAVMKARQAIEDTGHPTLIQAVHRVGYGFSAPVTVLSQSSAV